MTLKFDKNENGEVTVVVSEGTDVLVFSYIEMIKQLLNKQVPTITFTDKLLDEEKAQINELFDKIKKIAIPEKQNNTEVTEQF